MLYVAVEGGFDIEPTLGSVSTDIRGGIGGWQGRALAAGDRLPLRLMRATERDECRIEGLDLKTPSVVRAIAGPQSDYFAEVEIAAFFASEYKVGAGSNRMGMRLEGRPIAHVRGHNITSDAIAPGSVQVPGDGQPIVLLADRQTTGGYPKIATVISADLPALGRLPIGAKFRFEVRDDRTGEGIAPRSARRDRANQRQDRADRALRRRIRPTSHPNCRTTTSSAASSMPATG